MNQATLQDRTQLVFHGFVGYWGAAGAASICERLDHLLHASGHHNWQVRSSTKVSCNRHGFVCPDLRWQVASIGAAHQLIGEYANDPDGKGDSMLAALSASWRRAYKHPDGDLYPDAWVISNSSNSATGAQLRLGRDPFGRQPLYWIIEDDILWFASHFSLLLPLLKEPSICLQALHAYSCFSYVPTPLTPVHTILSASVGIEMIWQLPPNAAGLRSCQARQLVDWQEANEQISAESEAIPRLQSSLQNALHQQLHGHPSDQPVGIFLSGGLDSSIAAALLVQAGWKVRAYTLALEDPRISEAGHAQQVANWLGIPLREVLVTPNRIRQALQHTVQALDLPYGDAVTIPFTLLAEVASQETALIVNGEGGDQLFAGWTNKPLIAASVYKNYQQQSVTLAEQYMRTFHRFWGLERQIFQDSVISACSPAAILELLQPALAAHHPTALLHRLRRASLLLKGGQNIQPRATAIAHSHDLAVCSPFCDLDLAQLSFAIAPPLHLQQSCEKYILKRAAQAWLPPEIVWRQKRGMGLPLTRWCCNELWSDFGQWLHPAVIKQQGHWQPDLPARLVAGGVSGSLQGRRIGESLWLLLMWQRWRQQFLPSASIASGLHYPFCLPAKLWQFTQRCR